MENTFINDDWEREALKDFIYLFEDVEEIDDISEYGTIVVEENSDELIFLK